MASLKWRRQTRCCPYVHLQALREGACAGKLKVLCLHGYMQNGDILRHKMGSWRKGLKARCDFEFGDAPIKVTETDNAELAERLATSSLDHRSW